MQMLEFVPCKLKNTVILILVMLYPIHNQKLCGNVRIYCYLLTALLLMGITFLAVNAQYLPNPCLESCEKWIEPDHGLECPNKNRNFSSLQHTNNITKTKYIDCFIKIGHIENMTHAPLLYFSSKFKVDTIFVIKDMANPLTL